jgi:hypothetical protein
MRGIHRISACAALLSLVALLLGAASARGAVSTNLDLDLCAPDQNTFTLAIDNDFFPLPVGQQWVLFGKEQGETIGLRVTVLDATENLYRGKKTVTTRVVEEAEWADANGNGVIDAGEEIEISLNYFAQTQDGTVCYFGEEVDIYDGGVVVSHEGSWRADARGNAPGIFMPADPQVGMTYQQEVAPGVAEDEATIVSRGRTVTVPAGTFTDTIRVRDFNPLDGSKGFKVYAPNVGIIVDGPLSLVSY